MAELWAVKEFVMEKHKHFFSVKAVNLGKKFRAVELASAHAWEYDFVEEQIGITSPD